MAAALWMASLMAMVMATVDRGRLVLAGWAVLSALAGSLLVVWHLVVLERVRVTTIAKLLEEKRRDSPQGLHKV